MKQTIIEDFYFHLIQIHLKKNNFNFIKDINLINDFDLLKMQYDYKQHYNNERNCLLYKKRFYQINT